jgi:hypothetical protein
MSSWVAATASITSMNPATGSRSGSRHPTSRMTRSQKVANAEHDGKAGSLPGDPGSDPTGEQEPINCPMKFGQNDQDSLLSAPANAAERNKTRTAGTAIDTPAEGPHPPR